MNDRAPSIPKSVEGRTPWLTWAMALAGPLVLLGPMVAQGQVLFWGTPMLQFVPWHAFAADVARHGALPLWNPYLGAGAPLLANHQSALLYPPNWLLLFVDPAWGHGLLLLLHILWTAVGMLLLARTMGAGPLGQMIAAQAWSLSTFLVSRSSFLSLSAAAAWIPWVLLAAYHLGREASRGLRRRETLRAVLAFAVALAFQLLAGHAQTTWYGLVLAAVVLSMAAEGGRRGWLRGAAGWAAGVALAMALSAAQLLPTAEYLLQSSRASGLDAASAMTYSFWPWRSLGLLLPDLFGNPAAGDFWGYGNYWEDALYVGILPTLMAITVIVGLRRLDPDRRRRVIWLLASAGGAFVLSLGSNTPILPWLYRWVPTFNLFNAPARWNVVTTICLSLLAGLGADLWSTASPRGRYWKHLAVAGGFAVAAVGWGAKALPLPLQPSIPRAFLLLGVWMMLASLVQLRWPEVPDRRWWALVGLVVAADLYAADVGLVPITSPRLYTDSTELRDRVDDGHRLYMPAAIEYDVKFERSHRFDTFDPGIEWMNVREAGLPNTTMLDSLPTFNNFDPLLAADFADWVDLLEKSSESRQQSLLALADVGWLAEQAPDSPAWVEYRPVEGAARVRIVPTALRVDGPMEALAALASDDFDPASVVLIEGPGSTSTLPAGGDGSADVSSGDDPNSVTVQAEAEEGGWLLLSDAWFPGWAATVDGDPVALYRADGLFRAVWVPPGEHVARFDYRPLSFLVGLLVAAGSWIFVLLLVARRR